MLNRDLFDKSLFYDRMKIGGIVKKKILIFGIISIILLVLILVFINNNVGKTAIFNNNFKGDKITKGNFNEKIISYIDGANKYGNDNTNQLTKYGEIRLSIGNLIAYDYILAEKKNENGIEVINNPNNQLSVNDVVISITLKEDKVFSCIENTDDNKTLLDDKNGTIFADYYCEIK